MSEISQIVWQKWFDPLGEDDHENYPDIEDVEDVENAEYYKDSQDNDIEDNGETDFFKRPTKVIMTPMGMIPYNENTASNKIFNFWIGHTNFNLSLPVCTIIEQEEGVETLDIFTRYRFRIGVGKLFNAKTVMYNINNNVYNFIEKNL
tara:strand:+ start:615 stop:1058 length:444 start_codon:yes stop_codon:yes gene_type:complete